MFADDMKVFETASPDSHNNLQRSLNNINKALILPCMIKYWTIPSLKELKE